MIEGVKGTQGNEVCENESFGDRIKTISEIIKTSAALRSVNTGKRGRVVLLLTSDVYADAIELQDPESVHLVVSATVSGNAGMRDDELIRQFRRIILYQLRESPIDNRSMSESETFSLRGASYALPKKLSVENPSENEPDLRELLDICEGLITILSTAELLKREKAKGFSKKHLKAYKKDALEKCSLELGDYSFLKEAGFHSLLKRWGIVLKIYPLGLFKGIGALVKGPSLKRHINRLSILMNSVNDILEEIEGNKA